MGKLRLLTLSLVLLAALSGLALAATAVESSRSSLPDRSMTDAVQPNLLTGKVTEVNTRTGTFTVAVVFSGATLSKLPVTGEIIEVTYTETSDGRRVATTINASKSNNY